MVRRRNELIVNHGSGRGVGPTVCGQSVPFAVRVLSMDRCRIHF